MRFGLVLDGTRGLDDLIAQSTAAEQAGFDLVWARESASIPSPAVVAAALAPHTTSIRVGIQLEAGVNPVYLAEEAAVADLCLGGRLVLSIGSDDRGLLAETVDVLLAATAARPFRHAGERWQIPANLPENVVNREDRVRITPATAQLELPIWLSGPHSAQLARERCLSFVGVGSSEVLAREWQHTESRVGLGANRLRRVAVRELDLDVNTRIDGDSVVEQLRTDQHAWGMDVVLVQLPSDATLDERLHIVDELAARVIPRVQLDRLPPGLEQYWKQRQETAI
jgi:alkanesulfonate monooxygenase SsuD/methylene tetrahydromethanopterin reductase-like flavin-dependent oxidoreductase (luciferase family)